MKVELIAYTPTAAGVCCDAAAIIPAAIMPAPARKRGTGDFGEFKQRFNRS